MGIPPLPLHLNSQLKSFINCMLGASSYQLRYEHLQLSARRRDLGF